MYPSCLPPKMIPAARLERNLLAILPGEPHPGLRLDLAYPMQRYFRDSRRHSRYFGRRHGKQEFVVLAAIEGQVQQVFAIPLPAGRPS